MGYTCASCLGNESWNGENHLSLHSRNIPKREQYLLSHQKQETLAGGFKPKNISPYKLSKSWKFGVWWLDCQIFLNAYLLREPSPNYWNTCGISIIIAFAKSRSWWNAPCNNVEHSNYNEKERAIFLEIIVTLWRSKNTVVTKIIICSERAEMCEA